MKLSVRTDSARVEVALGAVARRAVQRVEDAVMDAVLAIQNDARVRVPVDTGRLRNSIGWEMEADRLAARVGTNVDYAPHVEYGTSRMAAQPYLTPAFFAEVPRFEERLRRALDAAANDAARGGR